MVECKVNLKISEDSLGILLPKDVIRHNRLSGRDPVKIDIIKSKKIDGYGIFKGAPKFKEDEYEHSDIF